MAIYAETNSSNAPSQSDLAGWADQYGMSFPVLSDPGWEVFDAFGTNYTPAHMLLAPGMTIVKKDWVYDSDIQAVLPQ